MRTVRVKGFLTPPAVSPHSLHTSSHLRLDTMANPRQRRKSRSGTAKVKLSKSSRKSKNKVIVKAPAVLCANWDRQYVHCLRRLHSYLISLSFRSKTVRQKCATLLPAPRPS